VPYPSEKGRSYPSIFGRVYFCAHRRSEAVGTAADVQTPQKKTLLSVAAYYQRNQPYMRYGTSLAKGWPIATGVIEGACRHLVNDRCELCGMRWSQPGAEALLRLRCVEENGDWEAFHAFRRAQRQRTLYGIEPNNTQPLELQIAA